MLFIGEALVDLASATYGRPGEVGSVTLGGGPYNAARAAARAGAQVEFAGALSSDRHGRALRRQLVADGVGVEHCAVSALPTTVARVDLDDRGDATYSFSFTGTTVPSFDASALPSTAGVVFTGGLALALEPMAETVLSVLERDDAGRVVIVDLNCRSSAVSDRTGYVGRLQRAISAATVVRASVDDLQYLAPDLDSAVAARRLLRLGARAVVVTRGVAATSVHIGDIDASIPVARPSGPIADTVGAGDTFSGVLAARLTDVDPEEVRGAPGVELLVAATRDAHRAAAVVVTRRGADPPTIEELRAID